MLGRDLKEQDDRGGVARTRIMFNRMPPLFLAA